MNTAIPEGLLARLPPPLPPTEIDPGSLDVPALKVIARLRRYGHAAYLVGGCVRDLLVGARPKDYDVATSAHPEDIRDIFRNSRLIGRRFRLAHVFFPGGHFVEVATFRSNPVPEADPGGEGETDLLVTDDNQFGTAEEDARRRDFTINGLFYDVVEGKVIDYVGGREDLRRGLVRTIGVPEIRFREDPVRGLRAARIAARLGFTIEDETFAAMVHHAGELPRCSPPRVLDEALKLLRSGASKVAFRTLRQAAILQYLLPPIEEVLVRGGPEAEASFLARLGALDGMLAAKEPVSDAVMLATLLSFLPMVPVPAGADSEDDEGEEEPDLSRTLPTADRVLALMSSQARLPRRVADRVRAIISSQRLFTATTKRRRRRGGGFLRTPHFSDSLQLFELVARATGKDMEVVERWRVRALQHPAHGNGGIPSSVSGILAAPLTVDGPSLDSTAAPPPALNDPSTIGNGAVAGAAPKKRRRRGGRGRRKKEAVAAAPAQPTGTGGQETG